MFYVLASGLVDPSDQQKFWYLLGEVKQDDPWDLPPELPDGVVKACTVLL